MKILQLQSDWKRPIPNEDLTEAQELLTPGYTYNYNQSNVDANVVFVSNEPLTPKQLNQLWQAGDLYTGDKDHWEGSFEDILSQIETHTKETT